MFLSRIRFSKLNLNHSITKLSNRMRIEQEALNQKKYSHELLEKVNKDFKNDLIDNEYWEKLRKDSSLYRAKISSTNFENKFVDALFENEVKDKNLLNCLKNYFVTRGVQKNFHQKSAYGQLLLMLEDSEYDEEIEKMYTSLSEGNILSSNLCINFAIAYAQSSIERFQRCYDYLVEKKFLGIETEKKIDLMNVALKYEDFERYLKMIPSLKSHSDLLLAKFRENADLFKDETIFLKLLKQTYEANCHLLTKDVEYVNKRLMNFGYKWTRITPYDLTCPNCTQQMSTMQPKELQELRNYYQKNFLSSHHKNDPKLKSMLLAYVSFLQNLENQFDLIIDGLNLSFQGYINFNIKKCDKRGGIELSTTKEFLEKNLLQMLETVVKTGRYKRILFIGRYSQTYFNDFMKFNEENNIKCRFFSKYVQDDIAVILASLFNKDSRIATNDYFSDHWRRIEDERIKDLFFDFIRTRMVTFMRRNRSLEYYNEGWLKKLQQNENTVHIPFNNDMELFKHLHVWYCYEKENSS